MREVFIVPFHVKRAENSIMPDNARGAYVSCYVQANDYKLAIERCDAALRVDGMRVEEILQPIHSMNPSQWGQHILDQWPDQANQMPTQQEFEDAMEAGKVLYGPFGAY